MAESPVASKTKQNIYSWAMTPEELRFQIDNYQTLKITESYRGIAALLLLASMTLTAVVSFFSGTADTTIWGVVAVLPVAYFTYKGHRWAIITLMILWTVDRLYSLSLSPSNGIWLIIWWAIFMPYFYKALKVENARRTSPMQVVNNKGSVFCNHCGSRQDSDSKFCTVCGKQIATNT